MLIRRPDDYFLLNSDDYWGLFLASASYYPEEFFENLGSIRYVKKEENIEKILIEEIGRNELKRKNFDIQRDIGRIFYK